MSGLQRWSGREARALREALRMSVRGFAAHLGVSDRTISKWEAGGEGMVPLPESQALLDTVLERAASEVRERFRGALSGPPPPPSAAAGGLFLVPSLEPGLIDRADDLGVLVSLVLQAASSGGVAVVALCGPGGFGKTTLATQACHATAIRDRFPEVLWVETGADCGAARVVELISDLCFHLDGSRPALTDPEQAGFHLARVLGGRDCLLVIDNVWSAADLAPFLLGGPQCVRLVTTRNVRVCPTACQIVRVGPMSDRQTSELLRRAVPSLTGAEAAVLAGPCEGWPLLASVVGSNVGQDIAAGAAPGRAVVVASDALRAYGPQAFDVWDSDERRNAIGCAVEASLDSLDAGVAIAGASQLRDRYVSLAIFPTAAPVPLDVLEHWWQRAYGWQPRAVRHFCRALADRSLISAYLADRDVVVLHDVFRSYLRHLIGDRSAGLHRSLLDAFRPGRWCELDDGHRYLWRHLVYHLHEAERGEELLDVLSDPRFVVAKAARLGCQVLASDRAFLDAVPHDPARVGKLARARALNEAGFLLHGLTREPDIAITVEIALRRAAALPNADSQRLDTGQLQVRWVHGSQRSAGDDGHVGAVVSVAACGRQAVSCGEDGTVRLWDLAARRLVRTVRGHVGWVFAAAISPSGELAASAGEDGVIRLWRTGSGDAAGALTAHHGRVRGLAFGPCGDVLVSGGEDGFVHVWDVHRRSLLRSLQTPGCPVWSVTVAGDATMVAASGEDEFVRLYDLATGELLDEKAVHRDWVRSVAFAPRAALLASGSSDRTVRLWSTADRRLVPVRQAEVVDGRVRSVAVSGDAGLVVAATENATVHALTATGQVGHARAPASVDWIRAVAHAEDGTVVAGCEDGAVRLWNTTDNELAVLGKGANTVWSAQFASGGAAAVLGHGDGTVTVLDAATGEHRRQLMAGRGRVWSLTANQDQLAAACADGTILVWSTEDDGLRLRLSTTAQRTWSVALAPGSDQLAASRSDGRVQLWDTGCGELLWESNARPGRVRSLAFDGSGKLLAAGSGDGTVRVWHTTTGELAAQFANPGAWARTVALDSCGTQLAVGTGTGQIQVHDLASGQPPAQLVGHTGRVLMLALLPDRDVLVSAAADGTARLWSTSQRRELAQVRLDATLHCAAFDTGTGQLLAGSAAGVAMMLINDRADATEDWR